MQVTCPHCSTRYILPESLLGPLGARVRCPRCREAFTVEPPAPAEPPPTEAPALAAEPSAPAEPAEWSLRVEPDPATIPPPPAAAARAREAGDDSAFPSTQAMSGPTPEERPLSPADVARSVLDDLAPEAGAAIAEAWAQGQLFARHGQAIIDAYEVYRRRLGPAADPAPFRNALRERWGIDLEPLAPIAR